MKQLDRNTPIKYLKGVGEARAKCFAKLGVLTVEDILTLYPRRYENRGNIKKLADCYEGEAVSYILEVRSAPVQLCGKSGIPYFRFNAADETGSVEITYFRQPWLMKNFSVGRKFRFYGKLTYGLFGAELVSPIAEPIYSGVTLPDIVPVYPLTKGLTSALISKAVKNAYDMTSADADVLPQDIIDSEGLMNKSDAMRAMHFPASASELKKAQRTLAYEELTVFRLALYALKRRNSVSAAPQMTFKDTGIANFFSALPFELTSAQKKAVKDVLNDLCKDVQMTRMVQGDVGSGKTVVAAAAVYFAVKNGYQCAVMAPTEILAVQHYQTFIKLLEGTGINVELLTGSMTAKTKRTVKQRILQGEADVVIGTHALIQSDVEFRRLGLTVTDEQHRFGVAQRAFLTDKSEECDSDKVLYAHSLVMSATPIPRTLSLVLYGDMDISVIDELPPGRKPVATYLVGEDMRERIYGFIRKTVQSGRQVYIICSLVEADEESEGTRKAAVAYAKELSERVFADLRVDCLHGKQLPKKKDEIMKRFRDGETDILVSTTVIEVGVDVPNASVIVIENAECFGLSQLHQLRGRVGRGSDKAYCILMSSADGERAKTRLNALCETNDGFEIAATDLQQRGPGDFFGERQSGEIVFKVASMADTAMIEQTGKKCDELVRNGFFENNADGALHKAVENFFEKQISKNIVN